MPLPVRPQALIFDMDGVVIDSEPLHEAAIRATFAPYGVTVPDAALFAVKGRAMREAFADLLQRCTDNPDAFDIDALMVAKRQHYRAQMPTVPPVDGVLPFIAQARAVVEHLGLTTSSNPINQGMVFDRFDLHTCFDAVVTAEDITHAKPHPQPYQHTAALLGVAPSTCVVIEDATHGVRSASRAGCTVIGLTTTFPADTLREAGADYTAATFDEVAALLWNGNA